MDRATTAGAKGTHHEVFKPFGMKFLMGHQADMAANVWNRLLAAGRAVIQKVPFVSLPELAELKQRTNKVSYRLHTRLHKRKKLQDTQDTLSTEAVCCHRLGSTVWPRLCGGQGLLARALGPGRAVLVTQFGLSGRGRCSRRHGGRVKLKLYGTFLGNSNSGLDRRR